jgi:hypothetical protein
LSVDNENEGTAGDALLAAIEQSDGSATETNETDTDGAADGEGDEGDADAGSETENADDADADEGEGDEGGEEDDANEEAPKPRGKLSGSAKLKARLAALEAKLAAKPAAPVRSAPVVDVDDAAALAAEVEKRIGPAPKQEDFDNYLDYEREANAYATDKRAAAREVRTEAATAKSAQGDAEQQRIAVLVDEHRDRLAQLEAALPGAKKAIQSVQAEIKPHVAELMLESDKSALLALYLAKRPSKLAELNGLSERAATREVTRLEQRLSLPKPKTVTTAPKPVTPVRGGTQPSVDPTKMSNEQYRSWRLKQAARTR